MRFDHQPTFFRVIEWPTRGGHGRTQQTERCSVAHADLALQPLLNDLFDNGRRVNTALRQVGFDSLMLATGSGFNVSRRSSAIPCSDAIADSSRCARNSCLPPTVNLCRSPVALLE